MNKSEREELAKVAGMRNKVAKAAIDTRRAELEAQMEAQLSEIYKADNELWAEITRHAEQTVAEADARIAELCRAKGVPETFRPRLHLGWSGRGENAYPERRTELRKRGLAQIAASAKAAVEAIEAKTADVLTLLVAGGLETAEARDFLESIPKPDQLMPPVSVTALAKDQKPRLFLRGQAE